LSGWIKWEKDLETDIRFMRLCRQVRDTCHAGALRERFNEKLIVTLTIGALMKLWSYADTHIRADDTMDLSFDDIDDIVGLPGFASVIPEDWLVKRGDQCVELPGFQEHNGTVAKKRDLATKRQQRHRASQETEDVTPVRDKRHAGALPDQTRPDQTNKTNGHQSALPTDVQQVFDHWKAEHKHPKSKIDPKRLKLIRVALQSYNAEQLCQSISGYKNSPHHMGKNDRNTVYDDIEIFLRDAKHIEAGIKFAEKGEAIQWT
jgi:hypothetical protein